MLFLSLIMNALCFLFVVRLSSFADRVSLLLMQLFAPEKDPDDVLITNKAVAVYLSDDSPYLTVRNEMR